jgi:glycosyltransferase involved in cell wall biosynthesis
MPVVAFVGRLEAERRLDVLIRAIPLVLKSAPDCRFIVAGTGSAAPSLRHLAAGLGVERAITWSGWLDDPYSVLSEAHVYVNTWPSEAFGMAMAEAMALGLPIVAPDAGACHDMVETDRTGKLVSPEDPFALAKAVLELVSDLPKASLMGDAARSQAIARYGARRTAVATLAFLEQIQEGRR